MSYTFKNGLLSFDAVNGPDNWDIKVTLTKGTKSNNFGTFCDMIIKVNGATVRNFNVINTKGMFYKGGARGGMTKFNESKNQSLIILLEKISNGINAEADRLNLQPIEDYVNRNPRVDSDGNAYPIAASFSMKYMENKYCLVEMYDVDDEPSIILGTEEVDTKLIKELLKSDTGTFIRAKNFIKRVYGITDVDKQLQNSDLAKLKNKYYPIPGDDGFKQFMAIKEKYTICEASFSIVPYFVNSKTNLATASIVVNTLFCKSIASSMDEINEATDEAFERYKNSIKITKNTALNEISDEIQLNQIENTNDPFSA